MKLDTENSRPAVLQWLPMTKRGSPRGELLAAFELFLVRHPNFHSLIDNVLRFYDIQDLAQSLRYLFCFSLLFDVCYQTDSMHRVIAGFVRNVEYFYAMLSCVIQGGLKSKPMST